MKFLNPNEVILGQSLKTSASENSCKRAFYEIGNSSDLEIVAGWLIDHVEIDNVDAPFNPGKD